MACTRRRRRWRYDTSNRGWVITGCINWIAVVVIVVIRIGNDKRLMKPKPVMKGMSERAVSKVIASLAAVISEGHANGGHTYCAEAKGSC
jgi:hypothetical protein